ncbi:DUF7501 family protein [Halomicrobium salinisoli]|uniref:DUF7501 family protein n=1 Tax=Halomicrobium salinisoli TaxID=2878391 RepID=UPI001CF0B04A|nr:hypothetical protein [Halomicrobium salinisoli]
MSATATNWSDPDTCPFCGDDLVDPGAGFVDHIGESPDCEDSWSTWRDNLAGDVRGEWAG